MEFPKVMKVQQRFDSDRLLDIPSKVAEEVARIDVSSRLSAGDSVAITAGSRGVANLATIIKSLVDELKKRGALPFVIPAMGSHGGGTANGQKSVLQHYSITESTMGVPIRATMDTNQIGETPDGLPVFNCTRLRD